MAFPVVCGTAAAVAQVSSAQSGIFISGGVPMAGSHLSHRRDAAGEGNSLWLMVLGHECGESSLF